VLQTDPMKRFGHSAFSILQSAIHYVQQHFTTDSIVRTAQLRETPCPFSGACETQVDKNFPTV